MGVAIRITHKRTIRRMNTGIYVSATDLTKSLKLKNQILIDQLTDMIRELRTQFNTLGIAAEQMNRKMVSSSAGRAATWMPRTVTLSGHARSPTP